MKDVLKLELPALRHVRQLELYKRLTLEQDGVLCGAGGLGQAESAAAWLAYTALNRSEETVAPGLVPSTTFLGVLEDGTVAGMIDIRHRLNEYLLRVGGHIGYGVRPDLRRRGYGGEMLRQALEFCRAPLGLGRVLVTCAKENLGSAATIRAAGGVLENEVEEKGRLTQRYWIELT